MKLIFVIILFLFIPSYLNADWFFSHKDFDSKRFSKLNQINKNNLNELE